MRNEEAPVAVFMGSLAEKGMGGWARDGGRGGGVKGGREGG